MIIRNWKKGLESLVRNRQVLRYGISQSFNSLFQQFKTEKPIIMQSQNWPQNQISKITESLRNNRKMSDKILNVMKGLDSILANLANQSQAYRIKIFIYFINNVKHFIVNNFNQTFLKEINAQLQARLKDHPYLNRYFQQLAIQQLSLTDKMAFFACLSFLQKQKQTEIIAKYEPYIKYMNQSTVLIFMNDAIANHYIISFEVFEQLYNHTSVCEVSEINHRFILMSFTDKYQKTYSPLLGIYEHKINNHDHSYHSILSILQIQKSEIHSMIHNYSNYYYSHFKGLILKLLPSIRKLNAFQKLKILDYILSIYPIPQRSLLNLINEIPNHLQEQEIKVLVSLFYKLIAFSHPTYIYSIQESPLFQYTQKTQAFIQLLFSRCYKHHPTIILELQTQIQKINLQKADLLFIYKELTKQLSLTHNRDHTLKTIKFLAHNLQLFNVENNSQIWISFAQNIAQLQSTKYDHEFLQNISCLINLHQITGPHSTYQQFFNRFCVTYIKQNSSKKKGILSPKIFECKILQLYSLLGCPQEYREDITNFINNHFIHTIKSIVRDDIFVLLELFGKLTDLNIKLYEYLYSNMSTFVIYSQQIRKFYLFNDRSGQLKKKYLWVLKNAIENHKLLSKIEKKGKLNILQILMSIYWNKIQNVELLQFLEILESPSYLNDEIKKRLKQREIENQDLQNCNKEVLQKYKLYNFSIQQYRNDIKVSTYINDITKLNSCTSQEINEVFEHLQFYEIAIESPEFQNEEMVPIPQTNDIKIHMIYICLKIFHKININRSSIRNVDIREELSYIKRNNLVELNDLNEFKLDNISTDNNYERISAWKNFDIPNLIIPIQQYGTFANTIENVYTHVILSLFGNLQEIKISSQNETFLSSILIMAYSMGVEAFPKGSLVELISKNQSIIILCSKPSKHKINIIKSYILQKVGYTVYLVDSETDMNELERTLRDKFKLSEVQNSESELQSQGIIETTE